MSNNDELGEIKCRARHRLFHLAASNYKGIVANFEMKMCPGGDINQTRAV